MRPAKKEPRKKPFAKVIVGSVVVKIYERCKGDYQVFEVADYSSGARKLRSFSDEKDARKEAESIARKIATGEAHAAQIRGKDAAAWGHATELLRPLGIPLLTAVTHFVESVKLLGADRVVEASKDFARRNPITRQPITVRKVADELIELKTKRGKSDCYLEDLRNRLDKFSEAFVVDVAHVTTADVQGWLDNMKAAPRTVKNFRDAANTLFKHAEARDYISRGENPVTRTQNEKSDNREEITIYTPAELRRLLAAAPQWFRPIIALQAFAGLRSADVRRLDWKDVKLDRGFIAASSKKPGTPSRRLIPITDNLRRWLKDEAKDSGKVFRHSKAYFHEVQRDTAAGTGSDEVKAIEWKHNALRHSFISYRVADVNDVPKVALESANSPATIFAHYRELVTPTDAKEWFSIIPETKL